MHDWNPVLAAGGIGAILFIVGSFIAAFVFWIVALVDAIRRQFDSDTTKIIWVCVVFFLHFLGALIYWFAGRPTGRFIDTYS